MTTLGDQFGCVNRGRVRRRGPFPAADDPGPGTVLPTEDLVRLSRKSTGSHPGVLALFPAPAVQKPAGVDNEIGQPTLSIPYGTFTLGLVVEGRGDG